ncbi:AraC family transcriptional regulator (plasmid) [Cupriavidus necator]|uniref:AraC family transcriptional regulator n=1 Tax=Cupriavidus necator TaxID=106590 RepID=A0A1U9V3U3_CUPNE|nr:AraC family transcriptional regulator [Cupriavidus necator]AQV99307.1 AraC family transcriptional regulator [Cupriavidus necator]
MDTRYLVDDTIQARELDINAARIFSAALCGPHSVRIGSPNRFRFSYGGHLLRSMSTTIGCVQYGSDISVDVGAGELCTTYNISLPVEGEQALSGPHGMLLSNADCGIAVSPEQALQLDMSGHCRKILVTVSRESLERVLGNMLGTPVRELLVFETRMSGSEGCSGSWWRMVRSYLSEVECAGELYRCTAFSRDFETTLLKGLLIAQPSNYTERIRKSLGAKIPEYVMRAKMFIETNFREAIHLEDIEAVAGVSRLKLFDCFRKYTGYTPVAYLKHFRLEQARAELMSNLTRDSVSAIALGVGFTHFGRFSADYKRAYAESPSETIHRRAQQAR